MQQASNGIIDGVVATQAARIRPAMRIDVAFIVEAICAESRRGHFGCDADRADIVRGLWHQIDSVVSTGVMPMPGERDGVGGQVAVVQVGDAVAGFGIVIEHLPGSGSERVELFAVAIEERFRGRGLGRTLVRTLAAWAESRTMYARCAPASEAMRRLLESCGFVPTSRMPGGTTTLELYRAAS